MTKFQYYIKITTIMALLYHKSDLTVQTKKRPVSVQLDFTNTCNTQTNEDAILFC